MSFQPTSSIRPVGSGAKVIAALAEAREKHPGDLEKQAEFVRQVMRGQPRATKDSGGQE